MMAQVNARDAEDAELTHHLAAIAGGDRGAFAALYALTSGKLYGVAVRVTGDREAAADVVQDAYLTVWRQAAKFDRAKGPALTWLAVVVRNQAIDALRKKRPIAVDDTILNAEADNAPPPDTAAGSRQAARMVDEALRGLPDNMGQAVRLAYLRELTIAEVAAELGAPQNTVKSWLRRGLARLATVLPADALNVRG